MPKFTTPMRAALALMALVPASVLLALPGFAQTRVFDLSAFDKIDVSSGIIMNVTPAPSQSVRVEAAGDKDFDFLELFVKDGELHASTNYSLIDYILRGWFFNTGPLIKISVSMPELSAVTTSGGADLTINAMSGNDLSADVSSGAGVNLVSLAYAFYTLNASSGASIVGAGTCVIVEAGASSGASINIADLGCKTAHVSATTGAAISLFASGTIVASASSGASINISGNPETLDANASSGGSITNQN